MCLQFGFAYVITYDVTHVIKYVIAYAITYVITYPYAWIANFTKPLCLKGASNITTLETLRNHWFSLGI